MADQAHRMSREPAGAHELVDDPSTSRAFKAVLGDWLVRDPVDANDAELLAMLLGLRAGVMLGRVACP